MDDFECEMSLKCWYKNDRAVANRTKTCMPAYGLPDGAKFGFFEEYHKEVKFLNYLNNGKLCKSMFAVPLVNNSRIAICASYHVNNSQPCSVLNNKNQTNMCRYLFNQEKTILSMPCDCTLMGGNLGRCPLANATTFANLASRMRFLYNKMQYCHT